MPRRRRLSSEYKSAFSILKPFTLSYMELLQEEDVAELIQKKEAQLQLKAEVDEINRVAQEQKVKRAEQEIIQDLKVI